MSAPARSRSITPRHAQRRCSQNGFSLIEIALALALMGVLVSMTLKSQELLEQYRENQFVAQVQTLIANVRAHRSSLGRWPGDCNRDGLVDSTFTTLTTEPGMDLEYVVPQSFTAAAGSAATYAAGNVCPQSTLLPFENVNVPFNELKLAGLTPFGEPNRKSANHGLTGFAYVGTFETTASSATIEQRFNAVLLTDVPKQAARRLATAIDGHDGTAANIGRVRRVNSDLHTFAKLWTAVDESETGRINVVVFFDRIPTRMVLL